MTPQRQNVGEKQKVRERREKLQRKMKERNHFLSAKIQNKAKGNGAINTN